MFVIAVSLGKNGNNIWRFFYVVVGPALGNLNFIIKENNMVRTKIFILDNLTSPDVNKSFYDCNYFFFASRPAAGAETGTPSRVLARYRWRVSRTGYTRWRRRITGEGEGGNFFIL